MAHGADNCPQPLTVRLDLYVRYGAFAAEHMARERMHADELLADEIRTQRFFLG